MQLFEDLKAYIGFDADDVEALRRLQPVVAPHVERVADRFHQALLDNDQTRSLVEHDQRLDDLRYLTEQWLRDLFGGLYDEEYVRTRRAIGRQHVDIGLKPQYVGAAMNRVRVELIEIVVEQQTDLPLTDALGSIERILDIDLALMLHGYWKALMAEKTDAGTELATRLAHEIRNPLNAIGLNLTLLDRKLNSQPDNTEPYTSGLEAIRTELQRIDNLTKEIKQYAQPISPTADWHAVEAMLGDLESAYGPTLEANDIDLDLEIQSSASDVYCDAEYLKQALVNVLENAVEAIAEDGHIGLEAGTRDGHTIIEITDDGGGVEATATERAFDLFYTTKASGTGIGLAMVKKIVEAHDGSVEVFREPSGGTTVRIALPRPTPPTEVN
jgi:signal transduction histidine kinase